MKRIFNNSIFALLAVLGITLNSCVSEDDYTPASLSGSGMQVYFSSELPSTIDVSVSENSFSVPVSRIDSTEQITIQLNVEAEEGSIYQVPASVTFPAGAKTADIQIGYDPSQVEMGKYTTIKISVADESLTTPYGLSSYTFQAGITPWQTIGMGLFRDGLALDEYGIDPVEYAVEIQENITQAGIYRIHQPYTSGAYAQALLEAGVVGDLTEANSYLNESVAEDIVIDATDPEFAYIRSFNSGVTFNSGDGNMKFISYIEYYMQNGYSIEEVKSNRPDLFFNFSLEEGIFNIPARSILCQFGDDTGLYYANNSGNTRICWVGVEPKDYSAEFAYTGRFTGVDNQDYILGNVTLGADVASARVAIVPEAEYGDVLSEVVNQMAEGSFEGAIELTQSGEVRVPATVSGTYIALIVVFNAAGEAVEASSFEFKFSVSGDTAETFTAQYIGIYTPGTEIQQGNNIFDEGEEYDGTLYISDSDESRMKIAPIFDNEDGLVFTMDADGYLHVDEDTPVFNAGSYGVCSVNDVLGYSGNEELYAQYPCYYDGETGEFNFNLVYFVDAGYFCISHDIFELTGKAQSVAKKAKQAARAKQFKRQHRAAKLSHMFRSAKKIRKAVK